MGSDGISGYEISDATKEEVGTEITLHIKRSEKEYLDKEKDRFYNSEVFRSFNVFCEFYRWKE